MLAIAVSAVAIISILSSGLDSSSEQASTENGRTAINQPNANGNRQRPARYVVQNGDTLTSISEKTGVSVERLQELNPDIDPQILNSGERLRLR